MRESIGGLDDKAYGLSPMFWKSQLYEVNDSVTKRELVQYLPKIKLVLGNGFDLHCGLNTKDSDYFNTNSEKYRKIIDWVQKFASVERYLEDDQSKNKFWHNLKYFENFWDIFCLNSYEDSRNKFRDISDWNWCNITK